MHVKGFYDKAGKVSAKQLLADKYEYDINLKSEQLLSRKDLPLYKIEGSGRFARNTGGHFQIVGKLGETVKPPNSF